MQLTTIWLSNIATWKAQVEYFKAQVEYFVLNIAKAHIEYYEGPG